MGELRIAYNWGTMAQAGAERNSCTGGGDSESVRVPFPISFLCLHPSGSGIQGEARVQKAMVAVCIYARNSRALPTVAATLVTSLLQTAKPVKVACFV